MIQLRIWIIGSLCLWFGCSSLHAQQPSENPHVFTVEGVYGNNRLALLDNGNIIVVGSDWGRVKSAGRIYSPVGDALTDAFELNTVPPNFFNLRADVAPLGNNRFITVWDQNLSVHAGIFQDNGTPAGEPFRINANAQSDNSPLIVSNASGQWAVLWTYHAFHTFSGRALLGRFFHPDGSPAGEAFKPRHSFDVTGLSAAMLPDGSLAILWKEDNRGASISIAGEIYHPNGNIMQQLHVDSGTLLEKTSVGDPGISVDAQGNLTATWQRTEEQTNYLKAQRFSSAGSPVGIPTTIGQPHPTHRRLISSTDEAGRTVAVWHTKGNEIHYAISPPGSLSFSAPSLWIKENEDLMLYETFVNRQGTLLALWRTQSGIVKISNLALPKLELPLTGYDRWKQDQTQSISLEPTDDPDQDGFTNALEYLLNGKPDQPEALSDLLTFQFEEDTVALNVTIWLDPVYQATLKVSRDLTTWMDASTLQNVEIKKTPSGEGFESVVFRIPVHTRQFFQLALQ